jgi:intracellular septation protein A
MASHHIYALLVEVARWLSADKPMLEFCSILFHLTAEGWRKLTLRWWFFLRLPHQ